MTTWQAHTISTGPQEIEKWLVEDERPSCDTPIVSWRWIHVQHWAQEASEGLHGKTFFDLHGDRWETCGKSTFHLASFLLGLLLPPGSGSALLCCVSLPRDLPSTRLWHVWAGPVKLPKRRKNQNTESWLGHDCHDWWLGGTCVWKQPFEKYPQISWFGLYGFFPDHTDLVVDALNIPEIPWGCLLLKFLELLWWAFFLVLAFAGSKA